MEAADRPLVYVTGVRLFGPFVVLLPLTPPAATGVIKYSATSRMVGRLLGDFNLVTDIMSGKPT